MKEPRTRKHCQYSGRCTRENCKYLHPPPHLKTQLEINGRNTLATQKMLQNLQSQQLQQVVGMTNLQLQQSPNSATLLAGGQGLPAGPGGQAQQVHSGQSAADINAMYSPYFLPVAVSMGGGQTMSVGGTHSSSNPYGSYFMPFPSHNIGQLTPSQAAQMGLAPEMMGLQTQMIPTGHSGHGIPMMSSMKKNDKLELPTTPDTPSLKRHRDPSDDALLQTLSGLAPPPPKKVTAGGLGHQGAGHMMNFFSPSQFPYHHPQLGPAMMASHQHTPVVPTPFPVMPSMPHQGPGQSIPLFAPMMPTQVHPTRHPQSNETIPVCRDFKSGSCKRPSCKYAHVTEDYVEIIDGKVTLCRYAVQNRCTRQRCKFYHPPPASSALAAMVSPAVQLSSLPPQGISSI